MEDHSKYYQLWKPVTYGEITCYNQLTIDEIIVHALYIEFYYPNVKYIKHSKEDKYVINEAIGRYCRKHDINIDHIFAINVVGDLVPKRLSKGSMNADRIINSNDGTLTEWEIKDNIKEIRSELNKRKADTEYNIEWIGEWK